jgi:hypothetical protein
MKMRKLADFTWKTRSNPLPKLALGAAVGYKFPSDSEQRS